MGVAAQKSRFQTAELLPVRSRFRTAVVVQKTRFRTLGNGATTTRFQTAEVSQRTRFGTGKPDLVNVQYAFFDSLSRVSVFIPSQTVGNEGVTVSVEVKQYGPSTVIESDQTTDANGITVSFEAKEDDLYRVLVLLNGTTLADAFVPVLIRSRGAWRAENRAVATEGARGLGTEVSQKWLQYYSRLRVAIALNATGDYEAAYRMILSLGLLVNNDHQHLAGTW